MIFVQDPADLTMGPAARAIERRYRLDKRALVPNLVGIRSAQTAEGILSVDPESAFASLTNRWDDYVGVVYFDGSIWREHLFTATTDPGRLASGPDSRGTAVMKPGQYPEAYALGDHRGYPAIVNWGKCAPDYWRVRREEDRNTISVEGENNEYIGLNIHRARKKNDLAPTEVGPYSAGCFATTKTGLGSMPKSSPSSTMRPLSTGWTT